VTAPKPLPCPFCGCKPTVGQWLYAKYGCWMVQCMAKRCAVGPMSREAGSRAEAIAAWNRRAK